MIDSRSAVLALIACILLGASSHGSTITANPVDRGSSLAARDSALHTSVLHASVPARAATLLRFIPWKTRIKSVLAETYQRIVDEGELGVAILPGQVFSPATLELVSCPLAVRSPLRC